MATYWYDAEFIEAPGRVVELVSIALVADDGREYYAVSTEFDPEQASPWVRDHVLAKLPARGAPAWKPRAVIRDDVDGFTRVTSSRSDPARLWAWYGAYDHVVLCQLFGTMPDLPRHLPRFTRDLRQLWEHLG